MSNELAPAEMGRLEACERVIERGMTTFVEVGEALADIRDSKLYRASHKTFDDYCKGRWNLGRARAYQLIEGAQTVKAVAKAAGADLSTAVDKISEWSARELKADPAAAGAEIKQRAAQGEEPAAIAKDIAARSRSERQEAKPQPAAKPSASPPVADQDADEIEELRNANEDLKAENAKLKADNAKLADKVALYERDGVAETVKHFEEMAERYRQAEYRESEKMAEWKRVADRWRKRAIDLGWTDRIVIDVEGANG